MCFAFVVLKEHTGGTVELRHDDTLGTIDDKGSVVSHERNLAHVNFLFLDIFNRFCRRFFIVNNQAHFNAQRHRIGGAAQHTFINIKNSLTQGITNIFQSRVAGITYDGKY